MSRYDQDWVDSVSAAGGPVPTIADTCRLLFVVTDTADGKAPFYLDLDPAAATVGRAGRLPRGEKADITVTAKEATLVELWSGTRSYDAAFMSGDLKVEGAYERWLDGVTPAFASEPWATAWAATA